MAYLPCVVPLPLVAVNHFVFYAVGLFIVGEKIGGKTAEGSYLDDWRLAGKVTHCVIKAIEVASFEPARIDSGEKLGEFIRDVDHWMESILRLPNDLLKHSGRNYSSGRAVKTLEH